MHVLYRREYEVLLHVYIDHYLIPDLPYSSVKVMDFLTITYDLHKPTSTFYHQNYI